MDALAQYTSIHGTLLLLLLLLTPQK